MQRIIEILLGLERGFLQNQGDFDLRFNPRWPYPGAFTWNFFLGAIALALVLYVYWREGRSRSARIGLGIIRALLLAFVLALLNRPVLTLSQSRTEPSILAIVIDDSASMKVRDASAAADGQGTTRFQAMLSLVGDEDQKLLRDLSKKHVLKFYRFSSTAQQIANVAKAEPAGPTTQPAAPADPAAAAFAAISEIRPEGKSTQVLASLRAVLDDLQGQRIAGIVMLTDGRSSPKEAVSESLAAIEKYGVRIYPVAIGSEKPPQNIAIENVAMEDAAFVKDLVNARVTVRAMGYPPGHTVNIVLKDKNTGLALVRSDGKPAEAPVVFNGDGVQDVEIAFKPAEQGTLQVIAEAIKQPGEIDEEDNAFPRQLAVLDAKIRVLYCEGYPRWDYRYLKNALMRDNTVDVCCLLFSADSGFTQEVDDDLRKNEQWPGAKFPLSISEMLFYDVVLFGDVDPRQFTDAQLQLVNDFVLKKHGGFGMVAGPRYAPWSFRGTPIEAVLPVSVGRDRPEETSIITSGWRPVLTKIGERSMIYRFFDDPKANEKYLREEIQPLFWYARGVMAKRDIGEVYAEHPNDVGPDGRKAPLLVLGRYGGRTLFSAVDDSWRWRFYTGESIFDNYWVQQLRYLAREKKLGQRRFTIVPLKPAYELGQQAEVHLRILDPDLLQQLPEQLGVILTQKDLQGGEQAVRQEVMERKPEQPDLYVASWTADRVGRFSLRLPAIAGTVDAAEVPIVVKEPRLELADPQVDRDLLTKLVYKEPDASGPDPAKLRLNAETPPATVRAELVKIASAAMVVPNETNELLWNAPLAMFIFVLLITMEWVIRKVYGML